jgi:hypothetical protein
MVQIGRRPRTGTCGRALLPLIAGVVWSACADGGIPSAVTYADSAGVTIVTNLPGALEASVPWSLSAQPVVAIGAGPGGDVTLFGVRDVVPLDGGRIAVANGSPPHVLVIDEDGTLLATLGREGEGPGEFSGIGSVLVLPGDSVVVWDPEQQRMSVFTMAGAYARGASLRDLAAPSVQGWTRLLPTAGGRFVLFTVANIGAGQGTYRLEADALLLGPAGESLGRLGPFPGDEMFSNDLGLGMVAFGAHTCAATTQDRLVVGTADAAEVRLYALSGDLERIVRWPDADRSVTPEMVAEWTEAMLSVVPEAARAESRRMIERIPRAERVPPYSDILIADSGRIWAGEHPGELAVRGFSRSPERRWLVFDAGGLLVATLHTPEGFRPYAVRGGRVFGVFRDELDVESVRAYEIVRE